jgi:hypothetical protein
MYFTRSKHTILIVRQSFCAALLAAGTLTIGGQACAADVFTLQNTNNGDGGVTLLSNGFDLSGANNGASKVFTSIPLA